MQGGDGRNDLYRSKDSRYICHSKQYQRTPTASVLWCPKFHRRLTWTCSTDSAVARSQHRFHMLTRQGAELSQYGCLVDWFWHLKMIRLRLLLLKSEKAGL